MAAATVRKDPRPRNPNGETRGPRLLNKDPSKFYVFVNPADQDTYGYYEATGYQVETQSESGVRMSLRTAQKGQPITYQGQVLMSIAKEERALHEQFGPDGDSGLAWAKTALEDKIINKGAMQRDLMRGFDGRYARAEADISALTRES